MSLFKSSITYLISSCSPSVSFREQRTYHECQLCGDFVLLDMGELDKHIKKAGHTVKTQNISNNIARKIKRVLRGR